MVGKFGLTYLDQTLVSENKEKLVSVTLEQIINDIRKYSQARLLALESKCPCILGGINLLIQRASPNN